MTDFDYDRIAVARESLAGRVIRTPAMPLCGSKIAPYIPDNAELFIKLELFQHTGSFKARGSCLGIDWLDEAQRKSGVAGFSGGNFALALAWAAQSADLPAKVVMSKTADPFRIQGCRDLGAEVVLVDGIAAALRARRVFAVPVQPQRALLVADGEVVRDPSRKGVSTCDVDAPMIKLGGFGGCADKQPTNTKSTPCMEGGKARRCCADFPIPPFGLTLSHPRRS